MALTLDPFVMGGLWLGTNKTGVYASSDCGATWSHVNTGAHGSEVETAEIWSLAVDFVDKGTIYVIGEYGPQGVWKSTNGGVDWTQTMPGDGNVAKAIPAGPSNPLVAAIGSIAIDPTDHLHLVAGAHGTCTAPNNGSCGAETKDGGQTWRLFNAPGSSWAEQAGPYIVGGSTWVFATLFNGVYVTTDSGATWKDVTPSGVMGATGGEFTVAPIWRGAQGTYYLPAYAPGGVLSSTDGTTWSLIQGSPKGSYPLGFAVGAGKLFLGDAQNGPLWSASESDPSTWTMMTAPPSTPGGPLSGPVYLAYDEAHHLLYSVNWTQTYKVWRMVVP